MRRSNVNRNAGRGLRYGIRTTRRVGKTINKIESAIRAPQRALVNAATAVNPAVGKMASMATEAVIQDIKGTTGMTQAQAANKSVRMALKKTEDLRKKM